MSDALCLSQPVSYHKTAQSTIINIRQSREWLFDHGVTASSDYSSGYPYIYPNDHIVAEQRSYIRVLVSQQNRKMNRLLKKLDDEYYSECKRYSEEFILCHESQSIYSCISNVLIINSVIDASVQLTKDYSLVFKAKLPASKKIYAEVYFNKDEFCLDTQTAILTAFKNKDVFYNDEILISELDSKIKEFTENRK